jgi:superfamily II DNA or RNA helicase
MRQALLQQALVAIQYNPRICLQWATGTGKSKAAIELIKKIKNINKYKEPKVLLVVAEKAHILNWKTEFNKWKYKSTNTITIICYASLKKYINTNWDIVVFDEAHHLSSNIRLDILTTIYSKYYILLSATLSDKKKTAIENIIGNIQTIKCSLNTAIKKEILPEPTITLIPLKLRNDVFSETIIEVYKRFKSGEIKTIECVYKDRFKYNNLPFNTKLIIRCTPKQKYDYYCEQVDYWKNRYYRDNLEWQKFKWLQYANKRKIFLGESKTASVKSLLSTLQNKRLICFCTSIEQAKSLDFNNCIHSKKKDSLTILDKFNNKKINRLFAVNMLQEGQNLIDIEVGIIVQLDGQERSFIQRVGRVLRAKNPIQYIFYYKDTRDEQYLNMVLEDIDKKYITYIN